MNRIAIVASHAHTYLLGVRDGWQQPHSLAWSTNVDHLGDAAVETLDRGINLGQFLRAGVNSESFRRGYPILFGGTR